MERYYKVVICGDYNVGKSCLIERFLGHRFLENSQTTIGTAYSEWKINRTHPFINKQDIIGLWDTAGQERFSSMLSMYYRYADAIIYCVDINTQINKYKIQQFIDEVYLACSPNLRTEVFIVFTKIDLFKDDFNNKKNILDKIFSEGLQTMYNGIFMTSSLTGENVEDFFTTLYNKISKNDPQCSRCTRGVLEIENNNKNCCYK